MKAYLTSFDEPTVDICREQLEKNGLEVVLLDQREPWWEKYCRFINLADDDCLRIDADMIVNENIKEVLKFEVRGYCKMMQCKAYDFYKNNVGITSPVFYNKLALDIIRQNLDKLDKSRPEATAWRLPEIKEQTKTIDVIVGMHGFFQMQAGLDRAKANKIARKQITDYDFELAQKLMDLFIIIK